MFLPSWSWLTTLKLSLTMLARIRNRLSEPNVVLAPNPGSSSPWHPSHANNRGAILGVTNMWSDTLV